MKHIICTGHPHDIGLQHGSQAKAEIERGLLFYEGLFLKTAGLSWKEVCDVARKFELVLERDWAGYLEEIKGIAAGASLPYASILALNVRTEIAYGLSHAVPTDGCTALSILNPSGSSYLAQNWDWQAEQSPNLIHLSIQQHSRPTISMITEAGIIGKIGLNDRGVGVCLNAVRALGVDFGRLPVHLALRACLESSSKREALGMLHRAGVASSCHILVADAQGGVGVECSFRDIIELPMDERGVVGHTNHYLKTHAGAEDKMAVKDSPVRYARLEVLLKERMNGFDEEKEEKGIDGEDIWKILRDEENLPTAICRKKAGVDSTETLFGIVMDLREGKAEVIMGRPGAGGKRIVLEPRTST